MEFINKDGIYDSKKLDIGYAAIIRSEGLHKKTESHPDQKDELCAKPQIG